MNDPTKGLPRQPSENNSIILTAMELADSDIPVFPVGKNKTPVWAKGKSPNGKDGFHMATTDPDEVEQLFAHSATTGIGMPTGKPSRCTVIDVDCGQGKRHRDQALAWLDEHRDQLRGTTVVRTGSGGLHYYCSYTEGIKNTSDVWAKGVDCRNDGGYVVIPPFMGYRFERQLDPDDWNAPPAPPDRPRKAVEIERRDGRTSPRIIELRNLIRDRVTWHEPARDIIAHLVGAGWSDAEILACTFSWTWDGYQPAETFNTLCVMINGARMKWDKREQPKTTEEARLWKLAELWNRAEPDTRLEFYEMIKGTMP